MSTAPAEIWIGRGNDQLGPHSADKIHSLHAQGNLRADDLLWWDGLEAWIERDAALDKLGILPERSTPVEPPPMPSRADPRMAAPARPTPLSAQPGTSAASPERARALMFMFAGLITFAVLSSAAFVFLRLPGRSGLVLGGGSDVRAAIEAAGMYKIAYAEFATSMGKAPESLADLGLAGGASGAVRSVSLLGGTLLFETREGTLAVQAYRDDGYRIEFRCGYAPPPPGMQPLGQLDSASATTIDVGDMPDHCR